MKKLIKLILAFTLTAALLAGCAPSVETKDLAIVEGMAIDKGKSDVFSLTFQIYNPQGGGGGGGGGGKSSTQQNNLLASGSGPTLFDSIRNATLSIGKKLYFSNTEAYIAGESLCSDNFDKLIDFIERSQEVRPNEHLFVARGDAAPILSAKKDNNLIPASEIKKIAENYTTTSKIIDVNLEDIYEDESSGIKDIALPAISSKKDEKGNEILSMDSTAVFHKNKLAGFLNLSQTRGALWIDGSVKSGIIPVKPSVGGSVSMEIIRSSADTKIENRKGSPVAVINVKFVSDIAEMETDKNTALDSAFINELTNLQNNTVKDEIKSVLTTCLQTYDADIFGFGLKTYEEQPDLWKKLSSKWDQELKTLPFEINVNSSIEYSGLTTNKTSVKS